MQVTRAGSSGDNIVYGISLKEGSASLGLVGWRSFSTMVGSSSVAMVGPADDVLGGSRSFEETLVSSLSFLLSGTVVSSSSAARFLGMPQYARKTCRSARAYPACLPLDGP